MLSDDRRERVNVRHEEVVREALADGLCERVKAVTEAPHQGMVNSAYVVSTSEGEYILRLKFDCEGTGTTEHLREKRCAEIVCSLCDGTPEIVSVGNIGPHSYSIQRKIDGVRGVDYKGDFLPVWYQIGQYAAKYHTVEVPGYNYDLFTKDDISPGNVWCQWYFDYLIDPHESKLLSSCDLTPLEFQKGMDAVQDLAGWEFTPHLCYGDLKPDNLMIANDGKAYIIDWGSAQGHVALSLEIAEMLKSGVSYQCVEAFCMGRGVSSDYLSEHEGEIDNVQIVRLMLASEWIIRSGMTESSLYSDYLSRLKALLHKRP